MSERESLVGLNSCRFEIHFVLVLIFGVYRRHIYALCVSLQQSKFSRSPTFVVIIAEV